MPHLRPPYNQTAPDGAKRQPEVATARDSPTHLSATDGLDVCWTLINHGCLWMSMVVGVLRAKEMEESQQGVS